MKVEKDYEEFIILLNRHQVKYCVVGSFALALYAKPRYTKDMDIFIDPSMENARKMVQVLKAFGFPNLDIKDEDFTEEDRIIQLGYEPIRIDLLTSLTGCTFRDVWKKKIVSNYGKTKTYFISKEDLIRNKSASARKQDLADLEALEE